MFTDCLGKTRLRTEDANPVCGDYCDSCGDCLVCYAEDCCLNNNDERHRWIEYEDN